jgi:hypothetical protein
VPPSAADDVLCNRQVCRRALSHATVQYRASTVESEYYCLTEALAAVEHAPRVISNLSIMISTGWEEDTLAAAVSHPPMMATALPSPVAR